MLKAKNNYYQRSHISEAKCRQLLKCFSMDLNAYETSQLFDISYKTIKKIYFKLSVHIITILKENDAIKGEFELDKSYFGAKRIRGKRGKGAAG